jgi:hypothetical protein
LAEPAPVRVTTGATLSTPTFTVSLSDAPSESLTLTLTMEESGPSGNLQSKLPAPEVELNTAVPTWLPPVPQLIAPRVNVSSPGSVVVKV